MRRAASVLLAATVAGAPASSAKPSAAEAGVQVVTLVNGGMSIAVDGQPTDLAGLTKMLERDRRVGVVTTVRVMSGDNPDYSRLKPVLDLLSRFGRTKVGYIYGSSN